MDAAATGAGVAIGRGLRQAAVAVLGAALALLVVPPLAVVAIIARLSRKPVAVGFGPEPLINHLHHVRALRALGISAESYCIRPYHITRGFDHLLEEWRGPIASLPPRGLWLRILGFAWAIGRYRSLAISFHGGPLGHVPVLRAIEPWLLRLAGTRTLLLPYGSDVQLLERNPTPGYRAALARDYPATAAASARVRRQIARWTRHGDRVINGCDWIDYVDRRDRLTLGHFAIDTEAWRDTEGRIPPDAFTAARPLRLLHAPNHPAIKGTEALERAVGRLCAEGVPIELRIVRNVSNDAVREAMRACDVIVDQLVIGWYAMFCLEGFALGRPVICRIREDLEDAYVSAGLIEPGELPHCRADEASIERCIRELAQAPHRLREIGDRSRAFVERHHSLDAVGRMLAEELRALGVEATSD